MKKQGGGNDYGLGSADGSPRSGDSDGLGRQVTFDR